MTKLSSLTIPATLDSVASKKYPAFDGCTHIEKVTFTGSGDWFDYGYSDLEPHYFYYEYGFRTPWQLSKSALKIVDIMPDVTSVGKHAFETCNSLECITVADSVKFIGECAFNATFYETDGVTKLQETADDLAGYTFKNFNGKWIKQKESGTCGEVFYEFDQFTGTLTIRGSGNMESYSSGKAPWYSDKDLITSIVIEDNVTSIGDFAFEDITSIKSIIIPNSVGCIGEYAFKGCSSLASYVVSENNNNYTSIDGILLSKDMSVLVKYPVAKAGTFFEIPDYVKTIAPSAFNGCTSLTFITIPDSVETIKDGAFDVTFYDTNGETALDLTIENLAGFTFYKVEDRWIKQNISGECGDSVSYKMDCSKGTLIISGSGQMYDFSIGETPWYSFKDFILSVNIGDSVTSIGDYAFYGCASLSTITIPNSVESIGASAFFGCHSLTAIAIPDSVTILKVYAFQDCSSLTSITIPDSVITIASHAFYGCSSLTSITIPDSVTTLGEQVFYGCISLTSVTLSIFIKSLGNYAFCGCTSLPSVSLPSSIRSIGFSAFYGCTSLRSITIPDSVESIGASAFKACASLTAITIPDSITSLENNAFDGKFYDSNGEKELEQTVENLVGSIFYNNDGRWIKQNLSGECGDSVSYKMDCSKGTLIIRGSGQMYDFSIGETPWHLFRDSIHSVDIEDSVTSIGDYAFYGCTSLSIVKIGKSLDSVKKSAFKGCTSLALFVVSNENDAFSSIDGVLLNKSKTTLMQYPAAKTDTTYEIPASVTYILPSAFKGCTFLKSLTIPDSVTTVETGAFDMMFYAVDGETELEPTVENLAGSIFNNIDGKWIKQKESGTCGDDVRYEFNQLTGTLTISGSGAMYNYAYGTTPWDPYKGSIRSVVIGDSVTSIGAYAFSDCTSLVIVTIPDSIRSIGDFAFEGNTSLDSITLPDTIESLGNSAFESCSELTTIDLGRSVNHIGDAAFYECSSLASFVVSDENDAYVSIEGVLFSKDMQTLVHFPSAKEGTSYVIPNSVTTIRSYAFEECESLTSVTISSSITTLEHDAFDAIFYDSDGETPLDDENLAGSTFNYVDNKWIKQTSISSEDPIKDSGECGEGVTYELNLSTGILTISGSGQMRLYSSGNAPWFSHKESIKSIEIADSIRSIGDFAFEGITSIESIAIPDSVETIGVSAFECCSKLTTVNIGKSVKSINEAAFKGCISLALFVVSNDNDAFTSIDGVLFNNDRSTLIQYPPAKEGNSYRIPNSVTTIRSYAFDGCYSLTSITIPDSVTTIEDDAFDMPFYDEDGETEIEPTATNLAGYTYTRRN